MLKVIYLLSVIAVTLFLISIGNDVTGRVKQKHPGWKPNKKKLPDQLYSWTTILFSLLCPVWNTFLVFVFMGNKDDLIQKAVEKIEETWNFET